MRRTLALALLVGACSSPTQLVVVVETNLEVPDDIDRIEVSVRDPDGVTTVTPQPLTGPDAPSFPLTLGVTPSGDVIGPITVTATARLGTTEVVQQSAEVRLVPGETRTLHLVLYRSCVGRRCVDGETCDTDGCVSVERDVLPTWTGEPPTFDDSDVCLAMPWDVDDDGDGSVACGGRDCDDDDDRASSALMETCDDVDNDCDGMTDEGCGCAPLGIMEECDTTCGSTGDRTCGMEGWSSCAVRAETCNGIDDNCDGRTDEDQRYVPTMPLPITSSGQDSIDPDLIWAEDQYALVWHDRTDDQGVHFTALSPTGETLGTPSRISSRGEAPAIAWNGRTFGVFYWYRETVDTSTLDRARFVVLTADGSPRATPASVQGNIAGSPRPAILWNGTHYVLGYRDEDMQLEIWAEDQSRVGARVDVPSLLEANFDMAWDGTALNLVFSSRNELWITRGDPMALPAMETSVTPLAGADAPALLWTGDGYLVAANSQTAVGPSVHVLGLDSAGAAIAMPRALTETRVRPDATNAPPGLASAPGQALVTWVDSREMASDVYFARVALDGSVLQGATRLSPPGTDAGQTTVAWNGQSFGVVWVEPGPPRDRRELMFARVACAP